MKDQKEYFVLKGDSSGKLYTRFSLYYEYIYTPIDEPFGFHSKSFCGDEMTPAPTHLIVAAQLRGDLDEKIVIIDQRLAEQARQFGQQVAYQDFQHRMQITRFNNEQNFQT
jgi:hypothetical protein